MRNSTARRISWKTRCLSSAPPYRARSDVLRERIRGLEAQQAAAADHDIETLQAELRALQDVERQRDDAAKAIQRLNERRSALGAQKQALIAEGRALNDRLERLGAADGALCPLCGQPLTADHREEMLAQLTRERDEKRDQYRGCGAEADEITASNKRRQTEIDGWALQLKALPALQQRLGRIGGRGARGARS